MKVSLFLSSLWLLIASFFAPIEKSYLVGTIKDSSGEALIGANVTVRKNREMIKGAHTDTEGKYRLELEPGVYEVEFSYTGFSAQRITGVSINEGKETQLDVVLESSASLLEEVVVVGSSARRESRGRAASPAPRKLADKPGSEKAAGFSGSKAKKAPSSSSPEMAKPVSSPEGGYVDGIRVTGITPPPPVIVTEDLRRDGSGEKKEIVREEEMRSTEDDSPASGIITPPAPRAGLLTAGEWNDLHNWNRHWVDLLADGETEPFQKMYSFYPRQRYTVMLSNENGIPMADVPVILKASDHTLWEARTDNTGKAELWAALFTPEKVSGKLQAEVWANGSKYEIKALKPAADGFNYLKVNAECNSPKNVDIVWAVDATGSMGDEIEYLKTELLDVIGRAKSRNPELQYRMGTVFYRDKGDDYITKSSGLSPDIEKTVGFIQKQFAGGGGDYPEAVHSALDEAVYGQKWSENAVARICFLVLDASPHQEPEVIASLQKSIREAARLGIRIVPVAASGVQKDTEFLMKFFGLATNGTYVFLTDHSGIGGKHLEPTTDEYKVEPLNDLLVRLITEYTSIQSCEGKSEIRFENDPQQQPGPVMHALYYPNPAVDQFTLELPMEVQSVTIYNSEGQSVRKLEKPLAGPNVIQVNDLSAGFYTIRILNNGMMQSGKLMVVRG